MQKKKPTESERRSVRARAELSCTDSLLGNRLDEVGTRGRREAVAPFMYSRAVHSLFPSSMLASLRSVSVTKRSYASPISRVKSHISDKFSYCTGYLLASARKANRYSMNTA